MMGETGLAITRFKHGHYKHYGALFDHIHNELSINNKTLKGSSSQGYYVLYIILN